MGGLNGTNGHAPGGTGSLGGGHGGKRPLMHIDDAICYSLDIDPFAPFDTVLNYGEECMKRAESLKDFGRPDMALKEYMKAFTTVMEVLPKNKGWASFISDRRGARTRYNSLMARITANADGFEEIKKFIKEDNARTGIQPITQRPPSSTGSVGSTGGAPKKSAPAVQNGHHQEGPKAPGLANGVAKPPLHPSLPDRPAPTPPKTKPVIHPKPQALHGNAIKPAAGGSSAGQDLAERFANLRTKNPSAGQDARTRQPLVPGQPTAPQHAPPPPARPNISIPSGLPDLPKVPDAIYSPARGTVSNQAAQLPSSTPRGIFSRTNSIPSFSNATKSPPTDDYFTSGPGLPPQNGEAAKRPRPSIPDGNTVSVQELLHFMNAGSKDVQVLLIDVRSRVEFDEGHIMSQSTICIEPEILQRPNISASEIADSMVIAPANESAIFEKRHDYDVVVFYDQGSEEISSRPETAAETAVMGLYNALSQYDFRPGQGSGQSRKGPKLLKGGIEAWTNVMGSFSLQTSSTVADKGARPVAAPTRQAPMPRRNTKYFTKPIQDAAEAKKWEDSLQNVENSAFVRTTDDFLRRFPSVSALQESMTSPVTSPSAFQPPPLPLILPQPPQPPPSHTDMYATLPSPPTRPAPTVPRPSHSGLAETDDDEDVYMRTKMAQAAMKVKTRRPAVGLYNPHNWCYANSSIQSLFGSSLFSEELVSGEWQSNWVVPMKADEKIRHPQIMAKILANFFHWMQHGKFETMKAKTLMEYSYHIHSKDYDGSIKQDETTIFGGTSQQDAQEFISFLFSSLHEETNKLRNVKGEVGQPNLKPGDTALSNALVYWENYRHYNDSLVDKYWRGVEVTCRRCRKCGHLSNTYEHFDMLYLPLPSGNSSTTIKDLLNDYCAVELIEGYRCDICKSIDTTQKQVNLVRLPDLLCIAFRRFQATGTRFQKNNALVTFPINNMDLTPYSVQSFERPDNAALPDAQFRAPFTYNCYAVIVHGGTLKAGHYRAYVRDDGASDPHAWHHFNDTSVEEVKVGSGDGNDDVNKVYREKAGANAYVVFYERRETA